MPHPPPPPRPHPVVQLQSCYDPGNALAPDPFLCAKCSYLQKVAESNPKLATLPSIKCALCPWEGGAFKRTEKGAGWVHLFCALRTQGVAFKVPDHLEGIILKHVDKKVCVSMRASCSEWGGGGRGAPSVVCMEVPSGAA